MKTTFRALFGVSALALMLAATPVLAAEVDVTGENTVTGADSDNDNLFDVDNDIDVDLDNDGHVDNEADADVDTGHNDQNKNTEGGSLESGVIDASTDWENVLNASAGLVGDLDDGLAVSADFVNDTTGADSDNKNDLDVDHDIDIDIDNVAHIFNKLDFDANTGHNDQNKNTTAGDLNTGDISLDSVISNWANSDSGLAAAQGLSTTVAVAAENHLTGFNSDNDNLVDVDNDFDLDVDNDAHIKNKIYVDANTGYNDQNKNTQGGSLTTGNIGVATDIANVANSGGSIVAMPSLSVSADLVNDTTGADSDNKNDVDVDADVDVDVDNHAHVENKLDVDADTGHNDQNKNTQGGDVSTGSVSVEFNVVNEVN